MLPTELTNLIIMRNSSFVEAQLSPTLEGNKRSHIQFQMIKYEDLQWVSRFNLHRLLEKPHTQTHTHHFLPCVVTANFTASEVARCFNELLPLCIHAGDRKAWISHTFCTFLTQGESLGQGSFTSLFKGYISDLRDAGKLVSVFLKELDDHRNLWEVGLLVLKYSKIPKQGSSPSVSRQQM